jgi:ferric iron reductase FhuF-like transporter
VLLRAERARVAAPAVDAVALESAIAADMARMGHSAGLLPIRLREPAGQETVPAETMLDAANLPDYFERAVLDWCADPTIEDKRAAASRFMRRYSHTMAYAALVPLLHGVAFEVGIPRIRFIMSTHPGSSHMPMGVVLDLPGEIVGTDERRTGWPLTVTREVGLDELRALVVRNLVVDHLQVAIDRVIDAVQLAPAVLWTTVAEAVADVYEGYYEGADPATTAEEYARADADKAALLTSAALPGVPGRNPLRNLLEWETVDDPLLPRPVQVRKMCCVNFVIPGRPTPYCRTCGLLSREERATLWRDFVSKRG